MFKIKINIGDIVKIGLRSAEKTGYNTGEILTFVLGYFEYDNGLYTETQEAPAIWSEERKEFDSIYHIFGNDLEDFLDSEIVGKAAEDFTIEPYWINMWIKDSIDYFKEELKY